MNGIRMNTKMDSIRKSSKFFFMNLMLMFMMISSANCEPSDRLSKKENQIFSTFSLSALKVEDRQNICNILGKDHNNYTTDKKLSLVRVLIKGKFPIYPVPAFQCVSNETSFYITFVPPYVYFKLRFLSSPSVITTTIIKTHEIPSYNDTQSGITEKIIEYFNTPEYLNETETVMRPYYVNDKWKHLCKKRFPDTLVFVNNDISDLDLPFKCLTQWGRAVTKPIPVMSCSKPIGWPALIVYFVDGIFFTTSDYTDLKFNSLTLFSANDDKDVMLTTVPALLQHFPEELVNNIRHMAVDEPNM